ncbi:MAG: sugar phosphate isomerase/epimerase family protein [Planctomycetota bacterium]|jgi:sugar phosphate isomerase/epimerase
MARPVTLFTGQWADMKLKDLAAKAAEWGYDGLELACWGDHMDVEKGSKSKSYCEDKLALLDKYGLKCWAISNHLAGQLVCDLNNDGRSNAFVAKKLHNKPEAQRKWAIDQMKKSAKTAANLGVKVVNGFTGSSIWHAVYAFPPISDKFIDDGFKDFAKKWNPIFDVFDKCGVKFALEVHPTEIAFDIVTSEKALKAVKNRKAFGFNFDPSHLHWQMIDPVKFINRFKNKIYHVHMKDAIVTLDGESGILSSHLDFGASGRGWDFRSVGRGGVDFEEIIRALNEANYKGPLSVEWEDARMNREHGARESVDFVKEIDFAPSNMKFDAAFDK